MNRLGRGWGALVVVLSLWVTSAALAASPLPAFPRDGAVAVQDVPDSFPKLRGFLAGYSSPAGAKYHVAVVAFTDPHNRSGPGFGDESGEYFGRLVEKWRPSVDTENAVIILVGLRNSEVRIHPFSFALAQAHLMNQRYGPAAQAAERVQQELRKAVDAAWSEAARRDRQLYEQHGPQRTVTSNGMRA